MCPDIHFKRNMSRANCLHEKLKMKVCRLQKLHTSPRSVKPNVFSFTVSSNISDITALEIVCKPGVQASDCFMTGSLSEKSGDL